MNEFAFLSATELLKAIRDKKISSVELLNLYIERFERFNPGINAIVMTDFDSARARATEADEALARGEKWGLLHGLPITIKDTFEVIGMPCTSDVVCISFYLFCCWQQSSTNSWSRLISCRISSQ